MKLLLLAFGVCLFAGAARADNRVGTPAVPPVPQGCTVASTNCNHTATLSCDLPSNVPAASYLAVILEGKNGFGFADWSFLGQSPAASNVVYSVPTDPSFNQFRACAIYTGIYASPNNVTCTEQPVPWASVPGVELANGCRSTANGPPPTGSPAQPGGTAAALQCRKEGCLWRPNGSCLCQ
jgi:hypothetical protein